MEIAVANAKMSHRAGSRLPGVPDPPLEGSLAGLVRWWPLRTFLDLAAYREEGA